MLYKYLHHKNNKDLIVFFSGFASEPCLFDYSFDNTADVLLVYDYANLDFNFDYLKDYEHVYVLAWSMGVAIASIIFENKHNLLTKAIAINGSDKPMQKGLGIDKRVFLLTLKTLSADSIQSFRDKMHSPNYFNELNFTRDCNSLKNELNFLYQTFKDYSSDICIFDKAILGNCDQIFKVENLLANFKDRCQVQVLEIAHYDKDCFAHYLCNLSAWYD